MHSWWKQVWLGLAPQSLWMRIRALKRPRPKSISSLYVVQVDFPMDAARRKEYDAHFDEFRQKYGIDFLVLEPGIRIKPFDEF